MEIVGYIASEEDFFAISSWMNRSVDSFCSFTDAERILDVENVYEKKLVDVGEGIMISEPVVVEKGLRERGEEFYVSLSHQGVLAIYSDDENDIVQFTDLLDSRQVDVEVEGTSIVAFYDDNMILLTIMKPLREGKVEDVFKTLDVSILKKVGVVEEVDSYLDTSLVHSRRTLYYTSPDCIPYEYNVDTKENREMKLEQELWYSPSPMGIDYGVKTVFQDGNMATYIVSWKNVVAPLHEVEEEGELSSLFVSSSHPRDLSKCVLKYSDYLIKGGKRIDLQQPIMFEPNYSVVRVYKDVFLLYDENTHKWVLSRIIVP